MAWSSRPYRAPELWIVVGVEDHDGPPCPQTCYVNDERGRDDHRCRERDAHWRCAVVRQDPRIPKKLGGTEHLRPWGIAVFLR